MSASVICDPCLGYLLCEILSIPCKCKGVETSKEICVTYKDVSPACLPELVIAGQWSKRRDDWTEHDRYEVEEIANGMDGRSFHLRKEDDEQYGVLICRNGQDSLCECDGFARYGRCKHLAAMTWLLEGGHIDHPLLRPSEPAQLTPEEIPF